MGLDDKTIGLLSKVNISQGLENIKSIVVFLCGLGQKPYEQHELAFKILAENNILAISPFLSPWNWMNDQSIELVDSILDYYVEKYRLENVPIILNGSSMGAYGAIYYSLVSKHNIKTVVANSPVSDLVYHLHERYDTYMALYNAFYDPAKDFLETLRERSLIEIIKKLYKNIEYKIFISGLDKEINLDKHCVSLFNAMKEKGFNVSLFVSKAEGHCKMDEANLEIYKKTLLGE